MSIKLTIGIPTYNGAKHIGATIDSIIHNMHPQINNQIEILVSDNASTDNTFEIIAEYNIKFPFIISYHRNDSNIGFDANVDQIFHLARGEFVEILGDDDVLANEALSKILNTIDLHPDVAVILLSVSFLNYETNQYFKGQEYTHDILCEDGNSFFTQSKWGTSAISAIIIKKNDWLNQNLKQFYNSQWIHIGGLMEILKSNKKAFIIAENCVTVRIANPRWEANFGNQLKIGMEHLQLLSHLVKLGYHPSTFKFFLRSRFNHNLRDILTLRCKRIKDNIPTLKLMVRFFFTKPVFWFIHLPFLIMPYPVFYIVRNTYKKCNHQTKGAEGKSKRQRLI